MVARHRHGSIRPPRSPKGAPRKANTCRWGSLTRPRVREFEVAAGGNVPELPGCMAHGVTPAEAVGNAQQAIALWVDAAREMGRPVPAPKGRRLLLA